MKITRSELKRLIQEESLRTQIDESVLLETPMNSTSGTRMGARDNLEVEKDPVGY